MFHYIRNKLTQAQIIAMGYFLVITVGTLLLMLPAATRSGEMATPLTALFTATSATCVTGLVVVDTASYWSVFGQCIILLMIQVGGLGFMTIGVLFAMFLNKKISLKTRGILQESMNTSQVGGVVRLVRKALIGTWYYRDGGRGSSFVPVCAGIRGAAGNLFRYFPCDIRFL